MKEQTSDAEPQKIDLTAILGTLMSTAPRRITALGLLAIVAGACHPWIPHPELTPWIAPGTRAVEYIQEVEHSRSVWRDAAGRSFDELKIQNSIEKMLLATKMYEQWPKSQKFTSWGALRVAPFRFTLVSINPTVVLMTPFDFGPPTGRAAADVTASEGTRGCLVNPQMLNTIECGISAVYAAGMLWFSPDLKVRPEPIRWNGERAEISLKKGEVLVLTHDEHMVHTTREETAR